MKKLASIYICTLALVSSFSANASIVDNPNNSQPLKDSQQGRLDPFDNDPFFQSQNNIRLQMQNIQKAMDQLMQTQFSKMNNLANQYGQPPFGSEANIEIKENNNELVYKIKLPKGTDNKVNVSVKNDFLILSLNATQKITHTQDNSENVTYSQSNYSQSFQLPSGYDAKSMQTNLKDSNLIVTFKKLNQAQRTKGLIKF